MMPENNFSLFNGTSGTLALAGVFVTEAFKITLK